MKTGMAAAVGVALVLVAGPARPEAAFGIGTAYPLPSKVLGETRTVYVHVPQACEGSRCAVLYLFDGEVQFAHTVTTTGFLAREGMAPPLVVVGIGSTPDRTRDLTPTAGGHASGGRVTPVRDSGGGVRFLDFVEQELLPWVDGRWPTLPYRVLAGHSFGGHMVLHALATRPDLFSAYVAVAPTLRWNDGEPARNLKALLAGRPSLDRALFVALGAEGPEMDAAYEDLRRALKSRRPDGFRWETRRYPDDTHGSVVLPAHFDGLRFVFEGWMPPRDPQTGASTLRTMDEVEKHYAALSARFGAPVRPPEDYVNQLGYALLARGDTSAALSTFASVRRLYPGSANAEDSLGEAQEKAGKLSEARASYAAAVEKGRARRDPNLAVYEQHLAQAEARLKRP